MESILGVCLSHKVGKYLIRISREAYLINVGADDTARGVKVAAEVALTLRVYQYTYSAPEPTEKQEEFECSLSV